MAYRFLGTVAALVFLVALNPGGVNAKSPSFILTGGDLGEHAAVVYAEWPEGDHLPFGAPMSQLVLVLAPDEALGLRYELYDAGPYDDVHGPDYHYFPASRLLYDVSLDRWYDVLPEWAAFMKSAIEEALAEKERGELEVGPIAAGLRQYHIPDGSMWLRLYVAGEESEHAVSLSFGRCPGCTPLPRGPERFVMQDMVATLSRTPVAGGSQRDPSYTLEYYASYGGGGSGGIAGFYAPPVDGEPGRFWPPAYMHNPGEPYFETTSGFDRTITNALAFFQTAAGDLESWVSAAQLRNMRLPEATFLLRRYAVPGEGYNFRDSGECPRCLLVSGPSEDFVIGDLADVMEGPLVGPASEMPPYAIEYEIPNPPDGFIREMLGMYRPPEGDVPGQFWFRHYSRATLYRETTPGFDAAIANALNRLEQETRSLTASDQLATNSDDGVSVWFWLGLGMAGVVPVLISGAAIFYRRRVA